MADIIFNGIPIKKKISKNNRELTICTGFPKEGKPGLRLIRLFFIFTLTLIISDFTACKLFFWANNC